MAGPVVTVSRQHGSGGEEVAQIVAERLGVPLLDQELTRRAAERTGISESAVGGAERSTSFLTRMLERLGSVGIMADGGAVETAAVVPVPTSDSFRAALDDAVREAAEDGAVIMGHAAQMTLRDRPGVLRVFVQAPIEARVARIVRSEGCSPHEAQRRIEAEDRERLRFYQNTYHVNWYDTRLYDCVVDTHLLGVHGAAEAVLALAARVCLARIEPTPEDQAEIDAVEEVAAALEEPFDDDEEVELVQVGDEPVQLRPMTGVDGPALRSLFMSLPPKDLLFLRRDVTDPYVIDEWARDVADGRMVTILAEVTPAGGVPIVVGEASLRRSEVPWTSHVGEVRVVVSRSHRKRGLGHTLMSEVLRAAADAGLEKVTAEMTSEQTGARRLVESLGFKQEGYYPGYVCDQTGRPHDLIVMTHTRPQAEGDDDDETSGNRQ